MKLSFKNITLNQKYITHRITDARRIIIFSSLIIILCFMNVFFIASFNNSTSALDYQSSQLVSFTFNPTVQITISDDLTIPSLSPGDSKDSNIITVTASSNAIAGYTLSSTVGSSTINPSTELRKDGTDTTHKFDSITTNKSSLSDFSGNDWGYSYCNNVNDCTTTANWISGDITITDPSSPLYPTTGYNGLPLYTTETPITLINSTTSDTNSIEFKIGARADQNQVAGEYTNIINFIGVANPNPTYITLDEATYMQDDFSCAATKYGTVKSLIDNRDNQSYLVAKANDGNCWMIENLKIGKTLTESGDSITLTPANSNVNDNYILNFSDIPTDGKFHAYTIDDISSQNDSNEWICRDDWDSCYYNWHTATAGADPLHATTDNVETSICPADWALPTQSKFGTLFDNYPSATGILVDNPASTKSNSAGKVPGFLLSGYYNTSGVNRLGTDGLYWSSITDGTRRACNMLSSPSPYISCGNGLYLGLSIRCVANQ